MPLTTSIYKNRSSEPRPPLRGLILDMDGTLFDSETLHIQAWRKILEAAGARYPEGWFTQWIGRPDRQLPLAVLAEHALGVDAEELLRRKHAAYRESIPGQLVPFPGVAEHIREWVAAGLPMAVCSSSRRLDVELSLDASGLAGLLPVRVAIDESPAPKPDPAPYRMAAGLLGLAPEACVAIEDSVSGIASAFTAGCLTLAVATSHPADLLAELTGSHETVFADTSSAMEAAAEWLEASGALPAESEPKIEEA